MVDFSKEFSKISGIGDNSYSTTNVQYVTPIPSDDTLASMSFAEIEKLRESNHGNLEAQNKLAPFNHRALIRELLQGDTKEIIAGTAATLVSPIYEGMKAVDILPKDKDTSDPQVESVKQAFIGFGEGIKGLISTEESKPKESVSTKEPTEEELLKKQVQDIIPRLIKTESGGRHTDKEGKILVGITGDKGITQVRPQTGQDPGYGIKPIQNDTAEEYIRFTKDYLTKMIQIFGSVEHGIAAYNAGPGAIHRAVSKAKRTGKDWKEFIPKTTKEYLKKVSVDNGTRTA